MQPDLALIVAMADNRVIGREGHLPWRQKSDLMHFRRMTWGKPMIMGRRTFTSIGKPLPGRTSFVVSRSPEVLPFPIAHHVIWAVNLDEAIEKAGIKARDAGQDEIMVIGGAEIFALALPHARRIYLTEIHADVPGDVHMPEWPADAFVERFRHHHPAGEGDDYPFDLVLLERPEAPATGGPLT